MKIRLGFVSNSSSSSFSIYGVCCSFDELRELAKTSTRYKEAALELSEEENDEDWEHDIVIDIVEDMVKDFDGIREHDEDGNHYLGDRWDCIDTETGQEFMDRIEHGLAKMFGKPISCDTFHVEV